MHLLTDVGEHTQVLYLLLKISKRMLYTQLKNIFEVQEKLIVNANVRTLHENISYDTEAGFIGAGNFCDVYEGKLYDKIPVAIKVCHGPNESLIREACLMAHFNHPNIIKFHGVCCEVAPICIVMEYCTGGSLRNHLQEWAGKIVVGERILYCAQAAKGMCYLQEKNLIHRDLASRNCLISKYGIIKIADFGLSQLVSDFTGNIKNQEVHFSVKFQAPFNNYKLLNSFLKS
ncbi:unnamed protein product [Thelazia callipaeda]|uniref:Protein kinase domain-containing protein n=1 Tax=Thelazia callipaeda TaxID=103827 RepID=A0A0N5CWX9_THECL|nr:unnamed protein product [Thelazia callipaeda]